MTSARESPIALIFLVLVASASAAEKGDVGDCPPDTNSATSSLLSSIRSQQKLVDSLQRSSVQPSIDLEKARENRPDKNANNYSSKDKNANPIFAQAKFDADMGRWQSRINKLTSDVNSKKKQLAQEKAKLASLQSQTGEAMEKDNQARQNAIEREREAQRQALEKLSNETS